MCCSEPAGVCHLNSEENVLSQTGHSAGTRVPRWEKELSLIFRFPDLQSPRGLAPWLVLYKPSWRVQQLKDGLEWNVFPLRWWVVKPDLGMGKIKQMWRPLCLLSSSLLQGYFEEQCEEGCHCSHIAFPWLLHLSFFCLPYSLTPHFPLPAISMSCLLSLLF